MLGHTWSLAVEMQYYLVWPAILILALMRFHPGTVAVLALALGLASAAWRATVWQLDPDWFRVFASPDTHADGLLIGSALGVAATLVLRPLSARMSRALWAATGLSLLLVAALVIIPPLPWGFFATAGDLLAALATAVVIIRVAIYPSRIMERGLSFRPLVWVGVISYGLYLWHVPIWVGMNFGWPVEVQDLGVLGAAGIAMLLTFFAAAVSYRYFERPFLRMKGRLGHAQAVALPAGALAEPG
jgi:peptidoglycan/LPS O-acetylase OafA/YrhL